MQLDEKFYIQYGKFLVSSLKLSYRVESLHVELLVYMTTPKPQFMS
jgi:hypothetical protein